MPENGRYVNLAMVYCPACLSDDCEACCFFNPCNTENLCYCPCQEED